MKALESKFWSDKSQPEIVESETTDSDGTITRKIRKLPEANTISVWAGLLLFVVCAGAVFLLGLAF